MKKRDTPLDRLTNGGKDARKMDINFPKMNSRPITAVLAVVWNFRVEIMIGIISIGGIALVIRSVPMIFLIPIGAVVLLVIGFWKFPILTLQIFLLIALFLAPMIYYS